MAGHTGKTPADHEARGRLKFHPAHGPTARLFPNDRHILKRAGHSTLAIAAGCRYLQFCHLIVGHGLLTEQITS
ncbi:hypothetical protein, partial [Desulfovibrio sp.]